MAQATAPVFDSTLTVQFYVAGPSDPGSVPRGAVCVRLTPGCRSSRASTATNTAAILRRCASAMLLRRSTRLNRDRGLARGPSRRPARGASERARGLPYQPARSAAAGPGFGAGHGAGDAPVARRSRRRRGRRCRRTVPSPHRTGQAGARGHVRHGSARPAHRLASVELDSSGHAIEAAGSQPPPAGPDRRPPPALRGRWLTPRCQQPEQARTEQQNRRGLRDGRQGVDRGAG